MWIEVELSDVEIGGIPQSLRIRRSWVITDSKSIPSEKLTISNLDGMSNFIGDFTNEDENDLFIEELIPYEVSQFFFFDGEKIQEFVRDEDEDFAKSLAQVLGISGYGLLHEDLIKLRQRMISENNKDADVEVEIKKLEMLMKECERDIERAKVNIRSNEDDIIELDKQIEAIATETRRLTHINAETYDELSSKRESMIAEKAILEQQIFETIKDNLPLVINAKLCEELLAQLSREDEVNRHKATLKSIDPKAKEITAKVFYDGLESTPALTDRQKDFYVKKLKNTLVDILGQSDATDKDYVVIHDLAQADISLIKRRIEESKETVSKLTVHLRHLRQIEPVLERIRKDEQKIAKDRDAEELFTQKGQKQQQIEEKKKEIIDLHVLIDKKTNDLDSYQKQHSNLEEKVKSTVRVKRQIEYCEKLCDALDAFSHEFKKQRADQLADYTLRMWKKIARKQDLINHIAIDPERHFSIDLYNKDNHLIDKTKMSAGEKELLAMSLIWAMSQIANRSLPVVIDTPLGRLDVEHRANIAEHYFPDTSHQVILLSTDTEIVGKELEAIKPYISKSYTIEYDKKNKTSRVISDSYFEKTR